MSSRPQPSRGTDVGPVEAVERPRHGDLACLGRRCLFACPVRLSDSGIERHADSCPLGVAEATEAVDGLPEMKSALAAALKASSVASRSERCMSRRHPRGADGPVVSPGQAPRHTRPLVPPDAATAARTARPTRRPPRVASAASMPARPPPQPCCIASNRHPRSRAPGPPPSPVQVNSRAPSAATRTTEVPPSGGPRQSSLSCRTGSELSVGTLPHSRS